MAGIGNAYSDEILHAARLQPFRKRATLAPRRSTSCTRRCGRCSRRRSTLLRERVPPTFEKQVRDFLAVHDGAASRARAAARRSPRSRPAGSRPATAGAASADVGAEPRLTRIGALARRNEDDLARADQRRVGDVVDPLEHLERRTELEGDRAQRVAGLHLVALAVRSGRRLRRRPRGRGVQADAVVDATGDGVACGVGDTTASPEAERQLPRPGSRATTCARR